MGVSKNRGFYPKMDGENTGKPYEQMDDLRVPLFLETSVYQMSQVTKTTKDLTESKNSPKHFKYLKWRY